MHAAVEPLFAIKAGEGTRVGLDEQARLAFSIAIGHDDNGG